MNKVILTETDLQMIVNKVINEMDYNSNYHNNRDENYNDDDHIYSFQYVLETYINGQFGQLRKQYNEITNKADLFRYLKEDGSDYATQLIDWIHENMF